MTAIASKPDHGAVLGEVREGQVYASDALQVFLDEIEQRLNADVLGLALKLPSYTVATVPTASNWANSLIYVSNETGGAVPAFSDGTNWRRVTDRAIVS